MAELVDVVLDPVAQIVEADWLEDDDVHIFKFNIPGLHASDVKVQIVKLDDGRTNVLQISGYRPVAPVIPGASYVKWHAKERPSGAFSRTFRLPGPVIPEAVQAIDVNGILVVKIPKKKTPLVINVPVL